VSCSNQDTLTVVVRLLLPFNDFVLITFYCFLSVIDAVDRRGFVTGESLRKYCSFTHGLPAYICTTVVTCDREGNPPFQVFARSEARPRNTFLEEPSSK
jgi:hypothetical protein